MTDKHLNRFILLFYLLASCYALVSAFIQKATGIAFTTLSYGELLISYIFNYSTKFIFIFIAIRFTRKYLLPKKLSLLRSIGIHTLISLLLSVFSSSLLISFEHFIYGLEEKLTFHNLLSRISYGSSFNFFVYFSLITMVYAFNYLRKQKEQELKEAKLKSMLLDSKISALQSQLQPHFLFNALNDISSLVDISPEKSQDAIADLSDMLRLTLNTQDRKFVVFEKELAILKKYLDIETIRFDEKLTVNLNLSKNIMDLNVPPLILQPIVENSIKHGFSYDVDRLIVDISITSMENSMVYRVENNGCPLDDNLHFGKGITNILSRLETLYGNDFTFDLKNSTKGVLTTIKFPKNTV